jgi:hypothetical protein
MTNNERRADSHHQDDVGNRATSLCDAIPMILLSCQVKFLFDSFSDCIVNKLLAKAKGPNQLD